MNDELDQLLKSLHLKRIREILDDELKHADEQQPSYTEFLARLLRAQWHYRQESALAWRIKKAGMPEQWTLESFPFERQPGISRRRIRTFADLDFIARAENIVFIGDTGVGKTGLAIGLLLKALQNGYRGIFLQAQDLFDQMYASLADRSSRKLIERLGRIDLLVIDEMGYLNLRPEQTNVFFRSSNLVSTPGRPRRLRTRRPRYHPANHSLLSRRTLAISVFLIAQTLNARGVLCLTADVSAAGHSPQ